ncbi:MAG TPA: molybdopterin-guanine dinucleotide biosynthesis protein MobB, partial [Candidatus Omnitrophota bacterium]|nr:molybdopterin-guanine dinucleotide biosynthesis protein MobB [Candidatus Omnitrophota bacterium]
IRVATIKHSHHIPAVATADAGAVETLVASADRFALLHEVAAEPEPGLDALVERLAGVDLVLVEGFKFSPHPKLEVWDPALGKELRAPGDASVVALACDGAAPVADRPVFARHDFDGIAAFIAAYCGLADR